jgi:4-amino-4-deoxy-L-arabinose transferase-like glycosyltransferase
MKHGLNMRLDRFSISSLDGSSSQLIRLARFFVIIAALAYILSFIFVSFSRLGYPYELEWIEGANVDQMSQIRGGNGLYVEPSISFIPSAYTPLYFYLSAAVMSLTGDGFVAGRLISIFASIGTFALIYVLIRKKTQSKFSAFLCWDLL